RAADAVPAAGVVDVDARLGVGVVGHVGRAARARTLGPLLIARLRLVPAVAAAAVGPAGLAAVAAAVQEQRRAADGNDVRGDAGPLRPLCRAAVAGGRDEDDTVVTRGRCERGVGGAFTVELGTTPTHRHGDDAGLPAGVIDRVQQVGAVARFRLDEQDVRSR